MEEGRSNQRIAFEITAETPLGPYVIAKQFATRCPTRPRFWSLVQNVHNVFVVLNVHSGTNFLDQNGFVALNVQKKVLGKLKCTKNLKIAVQDTSFSVASRTPLETKSAKKFEHDQKSKSKKQ